MSYYEIYSKIKDSFLDNDTLWPLLSPEAGDTLEAMAEEAHGLTLRHFGRTIQLYTPMYLSNYCDNQCLYCGFNSKNDIKRKKLDLGEVRKEAELISSAGLRHILVLTGESKANSPLGYIKDCIGILKEYFDSLSIEIYPLQEGEYAQLVSEGVDGLTIYQEVYDEEVYKGLHPAGPKRDYRFRMDAPERGAKAGVRSINIGCLLGLNDWRKEVFFTGMHAKYLQDKFPDVEIGISVPRVKPQAAGFEPACRVSDKDLTQIILALRIFLPRSQIALSTRESRRLRDNLLPLGITRMSADSSTEVGGRIAGRDVGGARQFEIMDKRGVDEIKLALKAKGYQPVLKDWMQLC